MLDLIELKSLEAFGIFLVTLSVTIFTPILCYLIHKVQQLSVLIVAIKHKSERLVFSIIHYALSVLLIWRPFVIGCHSWSLHAYLSDHISMWILSAFDTISISVLFALNTLNFWLLYFNKQAHIETVDLVWKKEINPRIQSWYLVNKQKWGNARYVVKLMTVPFLIYAAFVLLIEYAFHCWEIYAYSLLLLSVIFAVPTFVIYRKLKGKLDMFNSKHEIRNHCIVIFIFLTVNALAFITETVLVAHDFTDPITEHQRQLIHQIVYLITELNASGTVFTIAAITIRSLLLEMQKLRRNSKIKSVRRGAANNSKTEPNVGLIAMIGDAEGFKAFMKFLVSQWASESLLFVTELLCIKYNFGVEAEHCSIEFDPTKPRPISSVLKEMAPARSSHSCNNEPEEEEIEEPQLQLEKMEFDDEELHVVDQILDSEMEIMPPPESVTAAGGEEEEKYSERGPNLLLEPIHEAEMNQAMSTRDAESNINICSNLTEHSGHCKKSSTIFEDRLVSYVHNHDGTIWGEIKLPPSLPKPIVLNTAPSFIEQLRALYGKYVREGSPKEINISYHQRKLVSIVFERVLPPSIDYNVELEAEMFSVMDGACIEVMRLMGSSYLRFLATAKGKLAVKNLQKQKRSSK